MTMTRNPRGTGQERRSTQHVAINCRSSTLILEAAAFSGCEELWTEDLDTGATLRGVKIVNPLLDP
jgi:predicted nucleic acid-binding protein